MSGTYPKPVVSNGDLKQISWNFICGGGVSIPVSPQFSSDISNELKAMMKKEKSYHDAMVSVMRAIDLKRDGESPTYISLLGSLPAQFVYANSYIMMGRDRFSSVRVCWACAVELPISNFSKSSLEAYNAVCKGCEGRRICISCGAVGRSIEKDGKMTGFIPCSGCPVYYCSVACREEDAENHGKDCSGKENGSTVRKVCSTLIQTLGDECPCMAALEPGKEITVYSVGNILFPCIGCFRCCITRMSFLGVVPVMGDEGDASVFEYSPPMRYVKPFPSASEKRETEKGTEKEKTGK